MKGKEEPQLFPPFLFLIFISISSVFYHFSEGLGSINSQNRLILLTTDFIFHWSLTDQLL